MREVDITQNPAHCREGALYCLQRGLNTNVSKLFEIQGVLKLTDFRKIGAFGSCQSSFVDSDIDGGLKRGHPVSVHWQQLCGESF